VIAALYVASGGVYFGLDGVDPWDVHRDARTYTGPHPVVTHPPCERWGRYATGGPNPKARRRAIGDDGSCFACALAAVRIYFGVLEHPEASRAWRHYGLNEPPRSGGWVCAEMISSLRVAWTCCVEQGHYGHRARRRRGSTLCCPRAYPRHRCGGGQAGKSLEWIAGSIRRRSVSDIGVRCARPLE
jgi:hypothetical protein